MLGDSDDDDDDDNNGNNMGGCDFDEGCEEEEEGPMMGPELPPSAALSNASTPGAVTPRDLFPSSGRNNAEGVEEEEEEQERSVQRSRAAPKGKQANEGKNQNLREWAKKRKSLSGKGMVVDQSNGTRRSSRHRIRPLEYWRNECVVYSRKYTSECVAPAARLCYNVSYSG